MTRRTVAAVAATLTGACTLAALPQISAGNDNALRDVVGTLEQRQHELGSTLESTVNKTDKNLRNTTKKLEETARKRSSAPERRPAAPRAPATDPQVQPPLRGANPHGQGSTAVVDVMPSAERPLADSTDGGNASGEDIIAGRARGEQQADGSYRGHISILSLFGQELAGVNTTPGQTQNGPLQPIQANILDPLCTSSNNQVCLQVLTANSTTTTTGSTNDFAVARAKLGGLGVGAAESQGTISQDANCQTSSGSSRTTNVTLSGGVVAGVANSSSTTKACRGQATQDTRTSQVVNLGGTGLAIPAAGCADGTPDTRFAVLAPVATIVCNADEQSGSGVRQALDVFALSAGGTSLVQESTAQSESVANAPGETGGGPQCSDRVDNDGDGMVDAADPGCHTDGNPNNPASFDPNDNSEAGGPQTSAGGGPPNSGDGGPSNSGDGGPSNSDAGAPQCSDDRDNDGDGRIDTRDPGCHTDGDASNASSFDPDDDSEADGGSGGVGGEGDGDSGAANGGGSGDSGSLPVTGADVLGTMIAGLLMLGGGLLLRRRSGSGAQEDMARTG